MTRIASLIVLSMLAGCNQNAELVGGSSAAALDTEQLLPMVRAAIPRKHERAPLKLKFAAPDFGVYLSGEAEPTDAFPSVGMVLVGTTAESARSSGTATLIRCDSALTALHVVDNIPANEHAWLWFYRTGPLPLVRTFHPIAHEDMAVIRLESTAATRLEELEAVPVAMRSPSSGTFVELVGYGRGQGETLPGIARTATVQTSECDSETGILCWMFFGGTTGSALCANDSGGPVFEAGTIAAVARTRGSTTCGERSESMAVTTANHRSEIHAKRGTTPCAPMRTPRAELYRDSEWPAYVRAFVDVPQGTQLLRVSLNAEESTASYDLVIANPSGNIVFRGDSTSAWRELYDQPQPTPGRWMAWTEYSAAPGLFQLEFMMW